MLPDSLEPMLISIKAITVTKIRSLMLFSVNRRQILVKSISVASFSVPDYVLSEITCAPASENVPLSKMRPANIQISLRITDQNLRWTQFG